MGLVLMLLMALSMPVLKWYEKRCLRADTLVFAKSSETLQSPYELRAAEQVRKLVNGRYFASSSHPLDRK